MKKIKLIKGFTLIEILVVVTIIGMLVVITLYGSLSQASHLARDARRKADIENVRAALESYRSTYGGYPQNITTLTTTSPPYLKTVPTDPEVDNPYPYSPANCAVANGLNLCSTYIISADLETVPNAKYSADPLGSIVATPVPTYTPIPTMPLAPPGGM